GDRPVIGFSDAAGRHELVCDLVAGCDGFRGVSRPSVPPAALRIYQREYPFAWLGVLAQAPPSSEELIYAHHERGFALHSMRSPELTRLYVQCAPDDTLDAWPDARVWEELHARLETRDGWTVREGPVREASISAMRRFGVGPR